MNLSDLPPTAPDDRSDWCCAWIGYCITSLGRIENSLFYVCKTILQTKDEFAAIVFYKTPSFNARLALCDELLLSATKENKNRSIIRGQWKIILSDINSITPLRNALAHYEYRSHDDIHIKVTSKTPLKYDISKINFWYEVGLSTGETLREKNTKVKLLKDEDLPTIYNNIISLSKTINLFASELGGLLKE